MKMNRLIPMLPVRSIVASIEFYRKLGFSVETRRDDGGWAMLCFDECPPGVRLADPDGNRLWIGQVVAR